MQMEYTEIRPIRPNQSVVLAGLGVQGKGVGRCRKDRCQHHFCLQYDYELGVCFMVSTLTFRKNLDLHGDG